MKPFLRSTRSAGVFPFVIVIFFVLLPPASLAQDNSSASSSTSTNTSAAPQKQLPHQVIVITNDNIHLPIVPRAPRPAAPPAPQPSPQAQTVPPAPVEDPAQTAEIVSLQKQIKEKQKRIELLMHLFATDERGFMKSPTDAPDNTAEQARVRSEQEELRAETAACARLQARLAALTAAAPRP